MKDRIFKKEWDYQGLDDRLKYSNIYPHTFYCENCREKIWIIIRKGVKISGLEIDCENCGIKTPSKECFTQYNCKNIVKGEPKNDS